MNEKVELVKRLAKETDRKARQASDIGFDMLTGTYISKFAKIIRRTRRLYKGQ